MKDKETFCIVHEIWKIKLCGSTEKDKIKTLLKKHNGCHQNISKPKKEKKWSRSNLDFGFVYLPLFTIKKDNAVIEVKKS